MAVPVVEVSNGGYKVGKYFESESKNYWILIFIEKIEKVIKVIKVIKKLILSKSVNNKKCAFWHRKLTLKVKSWHFLTAWH